MWGRKKKWPGPLGSFVILLISLAGLGYLVFNTKAFGLTYSVDIVNHGQNGVIILSMEPYQTWVRKPYITTSAAGYDTEHDPRMPGIEGLEYVSSIHPSLPSRFRNPANSYGRFPGHERSLPEKIDVVWQLAELSDCDYLGPAQASKTIEWLEQNGYDPVYHVQARRCVWQPVPDKIYRKSFDMNAIRNTEAYKKTGTPNFSVSMSRYTLHLTFVFQEDDLILDVDSRTTNPWK